MVLKRRRLKNCPTASFSNKRLYCVSHTKTASFLIKINVGVAVMIRKTSCNFIKTVSFKTLPSELIFSLEISEFR